MFQTCKADLLFNYSPADGRAGETQGCKTARSFAVKYNMGGESKQFNSFKGRAEWLTAAAADSAHSRSRKALPRVPPS